MNISFNTKKLQQLCTVKRECQKQYPHKIMFEKIYQRLLELNAANNLSEISYLPPARCHPLKGDRAGQFAVDITGNFRLIFVPAMEPLPINESGGLDLFRINSITIIEIVDYH